MRVMKEIRTPEDYTKKKKNYVISGSWVNKDLQLVVFHIYLPIYSIRSTSKRNMMMNMWMV